VVRSFHCRLGDEFVDRGWVGGLRVAPASSDLAHQVVRGPLGVAVPVRNALGRLRPSWRLFHSLAPRPSPTGVLHGLSRHAGDRRLTSAWSLPSAQGIALQRSTCITADQGNE
jgi:hypothetical protein